MKESISNNNFATLKTSLLEIMTDRPILEGADKLEGFIAKKFPEFPIVHHHIGDRYLYIYPRIQYKIIDMRAYILGIEEGTEVIKLIDDIDKLYLGENIYHIREKLFHNKDETIGFTREFLQYDFMTPWLALNKENYQKFRQLSDWKDKKLFINNILKANIISMCKGFNFDIEKEIYVHSKLKEGRSMYKVLRTSFIGEFRTNFKIPDFFGIGGKTSVGFGTIKSRNIEE